MSPNPDVSPNPLAVALARELQRPYHEVRNALNICLWLRGMGPDEAETIIRELAFDVELESLPNAVRALSGSVAPTEELT